MAVDINAVIIIGRLTRNMELTFTTGGYAIGKFSVAANRRVKNGEEWKEEPSFFDVQIWGRLAESLQPYMIKGTQVAVHGSLVQNRWQQDGQNRSKIYIEANNIELLGSKKDNQKFQQQAQPVQPTAQDYTEQRPPQQEVVPQETQEHGDPEKEMQRVAAKMGIPPASKEPKSFSGPSVENWDDDPIF